MFQKYGSVIHNYYANIISISKHTHDELNSVLFQRECHFYYQSWKVLALKEDHTFLIWAREGHCELPGFSNRLWSIDIKMSGGFFKSPAGSGVSPKIKCHLFSKIELSPGGAGVTFPGLERGVAKPLCQGWSGAGFVGKRLGWRARSSCLADTISACLTCWW